MNSVLDLETLLFKDISRAANSTSRVGDLSHMFIEHPTPELREQLINQCLLVACAYAKSYAFHYNMKFEDIVGSAFEGLVLGVDHLVPDIPPMVVIVRYIKNKLNLFVECYAGEFRAGRTSIPYVRTESLDEVYLNTNEPFYSHIPIPEEIEVPNIDLSVLTEREQACVKWYFGLDCCPQSMEQIADELGLSRRTVERIISKSISKLRSYYIYHEDVRKVVSKKVLYDATYYKKHRAQRIAYARYAASVKWTNGTETVRWSALRRRGKKADLIAQGWSPIVE